MKKVKNISLPGTAARRFWGGESLDLSRRKAKNSRIPRKPLDRVAANCYSPPSLPQRTDIRDGSFVRLRHKRITKFKEVRDEFQFF
jgi:hypothetical protein